MVFRITLNGAVNRQDLFKVKNNFTLFFVVFLGSCIPETSVPSPALWSLPFIGLSLRELLCLYFEERSLLTVMNAGLFLSLGWLMYFPVITFLPLLIIAILLNGYTDWRHIAVIFVGSIALPLIVLPLWIWFPHLINTDLLSFWSALRLGQTDLLIPMAQLPVMIAVLVLSVTSIVELALNLGKKRVSNRKNFLLILWATLIALFGMLIAPVNQVKQLVVLALLPISLIMANFFYYLRNDFWSNALVIMLLIAALISVYIPQVI